METGWCTGIKRAFRTRIKSSFDTIENVVEFSSSMEG